MLLFDVASRQIYPSMRLFSFSQDDMKNFTDEIDNVLDRKGLSAGLISFLNELKDGKSNSWKNFLEGKNNKFAIYSKEDVDALAYLNQKVPGFWFESKPVKYGASGNEISAGLNADKSKLAQMSAIGLDLEISAALSRAVSDNSQEPKLNPSDVKIKPMKKKIGEIQEQQEDNSSKVYISAEDAYTNDYVTIKSGTRPGDLSALGTPTIPSDRLSKSDSYIINDDGTLSKIMPGGKFSNSDIADGIMLETADALLPVRKILAMVEKSSSGQPLTWKDDWGPLLGQAGLDVALLVIGGSFIKKGTQLAKATKKFFLKGEFWDKYAVEMAKTTENVYEYNASVRKFLRDAAYHPKKYAAAKNIDEAVSIAKKASMDAKFSTKKITITNENIYVPEGEGSVSIKYNSGKAASKSAEREVAQEIGDGTSTTILKTEPKPNPIAGEPPITYFSYVRPTLPQMMKSTGYLFIASQITAQTVEMAGNAAEVKFCDRLPDWVWAVNKGKYKYLKPAYMEALENKDNEEQNKIKDIIFTDLKNDLAVFWLVWKGIFKTPDVFRASFSKICSFYEKVFLTAEKTTEAVEAGTKTAEQGMIELERNIAKEFEVASGKAPSKEEVSALANLTKYTYDMMKYVTKNNTLKSIGTLLNEGLESASFLAWLGPDPLGTLKLYFGWELPKGIAPRLGNLKDNIYNTNSTQIINEGIARREFSGVSPLKPDGSKYKSKKEANGAIVANTVNQTRHVVEFAGNESSKASTGFEKSYLPFLLLFADEAIFINIKDKATAARMDREVLARGGEKQAEESFIDSYNRFTAISKKFGFICEKNTGIRFKYTKSLFAIRYDDDVIKNLQAIYSKYKGRSVDFWLDLESTAKACLQNSGIIDKLVISSAKQAKKDFNSEWNKNVLSAGDESQKLSAAMELILKYLLLDYITPNSLSYKPTPAL